MRRLRKILFIFPFFLFLFMFPLLVAARTPNIIGNLETIKNNIIVNISMTNISELEATIKTGMEKEVIFTIELIRVWKFWPDEFVASKKIIKTVKYDNLRDRYWTSSFDGVAKSERQFNNFESVKNWVFTVDAVTLAHVKELDPAYYYIRVVVESKSLKQLPMMGLLMHLVPEVEMSLAKESQHFFIGETR